MKYNKFAKERGNFPIESKKVSKIAKQLKEHIASGPVSSAIAAANKVDGTSQQIQHLLEMRLKELHFESEKKHLFNEYEVRGLTPDFYCEVGKSGIIIEVERGMTIANNMDLKDIWKCHLCAKAHFLFLVVPCERPCKNGRVDKVFDRVSRRIGTFFKRKDSYLKVEEVHLFGY